MANMPSPLTSSPGGPEAVSRLPAHNSPPPIHGILKKKSTFDSKRPQSKTRETSPNVSRLPSFSISGINEVSMVSVESVERIISTLPDVEATPKFVNPPAKTSPRTRYSPDCDEEVKTDDQRPSHRLLVDDQLVASVRSAIASIKTDLQRTKAAHAAARRAVFAETVRLMATTKPPGSEKDQSLVVLGSDEDSGSETERVNLTNNRAAIGLAVQTYASDPQQMKDLMEVIETTGTPRLSLLMRKNKVEGLYKRHWEQEFLLTVNKFDQDFEINLHNCH